MARSRLEEIREVRLEKMQKLREMGIDPYPSQSKKEYDNQHLLDNYDSLQGQTVTTAGRIMSWREHGNLTFGHIQDASGEIQLFIKSDQLANTDPQSQNIGFNDLNLLDVGDFIQATGILTKTTRGEISVSPESIKILSKSIRPLPEKHDGLKDAEERMRRRYVETVVNREVFQRFTRRALFWEAHREFFTKKGFVEMNIPVLEHIPGGGDANPFVTHMDSIDEDFYLRISQELYLKRLIGGGYEKVYEIGPRFRNEGLSDEHLPEHMAMEFYWAYADWRDGIKFVKELYDYVLERVYGNKKVFEIRGFTVDFSQGWEEIDFGQIFQDKYDTSPYGISLEAVEKLLIENNIDRDFQINIPRGVDNLWKNIRTQVSGPAFLINHPKYLSPLQKPSKDNPEIVERIQPIIAGSELGNGWSEVNNPVEQFERFYEQQKLRDEGDVEAQWLDIDYVEMLEYGMPPTFGWGHSERLFWFLEDVPARHGVPFPQLKFKIPKLTKDIYGLDDIEFKPIRSEPTGDGEATISDQLKNKFPGISFAYTIIKGVNLKKKNEDLELLKKKVIENIEKLTMEEVRELTPISSYRTMLKETGIDVGSRMPSPEALLKRIVKGKGLYTINTAVDAYNVAVMETAVGLGGFDAKYLEFPVELRFSKEGEEMKLLGEDNVTKTQDGEIIYSDKKGPITLDLNYRDIDRTKITLDTKNIVLFADGGPGIEKDVLVDALQKGTEYIKDFCGGEIGEIQFVN